MSLLIPNVDNAFVLHGPSGPARQLTALTNVGVLPGAFNPLHSGHQSLRGVAVDMLKQDVVYELSVKNVAKSLLNDHDVTERIRQFGDSPVAITRAPLFTDKSMLFRGCCFVVGVDTAERIVFPKFYEDNVEKMQAALRQLQQQGNRFLVGGRLDNRQASGRFLGVQDLKIPEGFRDLFVGIPESRFRDDVSSTQLRNDG